jgi:hypothetical protein
LLPLADQGRLGVVLLYVASTGTLTDRYYIHYA